MAWGVCCTAGPLNIVIIRPRLASCQWAGRPENVELGMDRAAVMGEESGPDLLPNRPVLNRCKKG